MIYGIGTDISEVKRFKKWLENPSMIQRFFNDKEIFNGEANDERKLQHYAARFSAKEAFVKALGTGFKNFSLKEIYVTKDIEGKPFINVTGNAEKILKERCGNCSMNLTLSHEKEYAVAFVVIEKN